ncbi:glycosyltransferase [Yimella radicis]
MGAFDVTPDSQCVVLFTNYFPFHRGEEYIETELPHLVERFRRVIIVPVMYEPWMEQTRSLPARVTVVAVDMPSRTLARIGDAARYLPSAIRSGWLRGVGKRHPARLAYDSYFTTRSIAFWYRARRRVLAAVGPTDSVAIYSYWLYVTAFAAILLEQELGSRATAVVSRAHRYDVVVSASPLKFLPQRAALVGGLDRVYPVSREGRAAILHDVPDAAHKVNVRRLGVLGPAELHSRSNDPFEIVSCSSLKSVKRVPLIVDALAILAANAVPFHWTHFGGDGDALEKLRGEVSEKLPSGAWSLRGHVSNAEVLAHYASHPVSVFVNVSQSEGVPVSIMEAFANAVPVLATAAGGSADIVEDGQNGVLLPVEVGADEVARALSELAQLSDSGFQELSEGARASWQSGWSADQVYAEFADELVRLRR